MVIEDKESLFWTETDSLGPMKVPKSAYFGVFTVRALDNFQISGIHIDKEFIISLAQVKKAAAITNYELGYLNKTKMEAMLSALNEIEEGNLDSNFKLDVFQAGAGTPYNMNMNEVVANRANEILGQSIGSYKPIHPNDHVNMSQSSNDTIPTAIRLTTIKLVKKLSQELLFLQQSLEGKSIEFKDVYKSGRTHTQDAVPITLGQEFSAYSASVNSGRQHLENTINIMRVLPIGGTAVGTGINTHPEYASKMVNNLKSTTGLDIVLAENIFQSMQFTADFTNLMNALSNISSNLIKICNDLMMFSSGPETGLKEINLPPVEPGSSIMPGKINPSILECCNMVFMQVIGNRLVVETASQHGAFELNVYTPLIAYNLFTSLKWMTNAVITLNYKCIQGISVNKKVTQKYFNDSNALATLLNPIIGYDEATELAKQSKKKNKPIAELVIQERILSKEQMEKILKASIRPNMNVIDEIKKEINKQNHK